MAVASTAGLWPHAASLFVRFLLYPALSHTHTHTHTTHTHTHKHNTHNTHTHTHTHTTYTYTILPPSSQAELIAVVQNTAPLECAGAISVLNHFYGRDSMPIGAYNINTPNASLNQQQPLSYVSDIVGHFDSPIKSSAEVRSCPSP
jgi:hypothetical protein